MMGRLKSDQGQLFHEFHILAIVKPFITAPGSTEGMAIAHLPISRRSASQSGRPFSRIRIAAASTS